MTNTFPIHSQALGYLFLAGGKPEIRLVQDAEGPHAPYSPELLASALVRPGGAVDHEEDYVRAPRRPSSHRDPLRLNLAPRLRYPRRVLEVVCEALYVYPLSEQVPRRARYGRHYGPLLPDQGVVQAALARVSRPHDRDTYASP